MNIEEIEVFLAKRVRNFAANEDPAHDFLHLSRVVTTARRLCAEENAIAEIVIPAAWLHDLVVVPKNDPRRSQASRLSAQAAIEFLMEIGYPKTYFEAIVHAIEAHSFSANIRPQTIEACVVQDADRLDGLGAIGVARCFATAGIMKRTFYNEEDPFCEHRVPDDSRFTLDHFFSKLFKTAETLNTKSGRAEGLRRVIFMRNFLEQLRDQI